MKTIKVSAVLALAGFAAGASAQTAGTSFGNQSFTVSATFTAQCRIIAPSSNSLTTSYTAFQAGAAATNSITMNVECTRGQATPKMSWGDASAAVADATHESTGLTNNNLQYTIKAERAAVAAGSAATASSTLTGTPDVHAYTVSATFLAGQAGSTTAGTAATRTLTLVY